MEKTPSGKMSKTNWSRVLPAYGLLLIWLFVIVLFVVLLPDSFSRPANLRSVLSSQAILLILALGVVPALAVAEFDLSIAATLGLSMVIVGYLNIVVEWSILPAVSMGLLAGVFMGALNSALIVGLGINPIVVTLATGTLATGISLGINPVAIGGIDRGLVAATRTPILGVQSIFFYGVALTLLLWYVFKWTPIGRYLYFVGEGREVARLAGLPVARIRVLALMVASVVAALGGVLATGFLGGADATVGPSLLLPAFATAFLGATVITPGRFNPLGTAVAVYFLATGINALQLYGLSGWIEQTFYGVSLIGAVTASRLAELRNERLGLVGGGVAS